MSFKLFIYYCALCGGWAALIAWAFAWCMGGTSTDPRTLFGSSAFLKTILIASLLGLLVAAAIGALDAMLNAVGSQRFLRVGVCMSVGFIGGAFGGLVGEGLHQLNDFLLLIGWIIVGVAVGASVGVFDIVRAATSGQDIRVAMKKTLNGIYGGFLGGFIGGVFFGALAFVHLKDYLPNSSLAIGLVLLGMCIGLLIGLAQVVLKEAWVKVEAGFRAGREIMLTKDETTIGRAESCDLGLFGDNTIERLHARIERKNNQYVLADVETAGGTFLNDKPVRKSTPLRNGDAIRVGNSVLRFGERAKR